MKRLLMAVAFVGILSNGVLGGEIPTGDFVSPSPVRRPTSTTSSSQAIGLAEGSSVDSEHAFDALQSVFLTALSILAR